MCIFISILSISSPNPVSNHLLEWSHRGESNNWLNIGYGDEIMQAMLIEVNLTHLIYGDLIFVLSPLNICCLI